MTLDEIRQKYNEKSNEVDHWLKDELGKAMVECGLVGRKVRRKRDGVIGVIMVDFDAYARTPYKLNFHKLKKDGTSATYSSGWVWSFDDFEPVEEATK